ncbi:hypothetical protein K8R32_05380 [bacterium]|nr:hypothetical protein [bacterium]
MQQKRILIIAGPTGVGESTITKEIIKRFPIFKRLVTSTTRPPRLNEKHTQDYYFFSEKKFKQEIKNGNILEYQNTRNKIYYGSYKPDLEKKLTQGFNVIVNPDIVGAKFFKKNNNATTIFIKPDSIINLKKRLLARDSKQTKKELTKRLKYARYELKDKTDFYDYTVINEQNKLEKTLKKIISILKKEEYNLKLPNIKKKRKKSLA